MINLEMHPDRLRRAVRQAHERGIIVPTFAQMRDPETIPAPIVDRLRKVGLWDLHPLNLFRITWKNEPVKTGGRFGDVNTFEFPPELPGVPARIIALVGKWFPTGAHKVGATFGCLVPRLVTGQFDPTFHKAAWPSTGNYCRGGAYNSNLLGCESIAILPEGMSRERFEWLAKVAGEVIATPGSESNVWEGCGDFLKAEVPASKLVVSAALQCPTLLAHGFGAHRIEGIGDKHVPWIHNVRNTDMVVAIDDEDPMALIRLFNEPAGRAFLKKAGVSADVVDRLDLLGISGVANLLSAIKCAKFYNLGCEDIVLTVLTDSMELYRTRLTELEQAHGPYSEGEAAVDFEGRLHGQKTDNVLELGMKERKRIHNLKYFTWVEQMGHSVDELNAQWDDFPGYWDRIHDSVDAIDEKIREFNDEVGLLKEMAR
ncbi:MAG: pyridoxal-5-phosphate-dependent protein subunit beta [Candidatus Bipolaricaulota bacterium]|nr:pyridoxal-5-phosphate-dependent protein subunit beta [Candidatus Bipolaricaulota bacterium]